MGVRKLYDQNKEAFSGLKEAEETKGIMMTLFPEVFRFQEQIVLHAHQEKKIVSPFGYVRRFYEAMTYKNGALVKGEEAEQAIAFLPANTAFAIKKEAMLRLEELGALERFRFFNDIHDSLMLEPDEKDIDECHVVFQEMTRPVELLGGLVCGAEVSIGPSWTELKEVKM